ncbi:16S rRNA (cytosine(1402)-N(4))-methyltransferase RsmH [Spirulina subsalsa FACHB-351]|uniref:Ribosomal RNA small subunit methyltransferase H n=1 Tax=Spirulina subsalsa FACHB-351 TaxID=234711 RepID=A0ABT3L7B6_9CYAN|nr:16S rRNA (cytosine(1402)-N(4))-methyltransferase RsmH [Spirulina subsalsa]MCW6037398.1 16S rRNA (cytosine(1402)-N(4))-methyltransferase RsmH [Spirulina subsalsa FACHB-351]
MSSSSSSFVHIPVLSQELITGLEVKAGGYYLDATVGGGGHTALILASAPDVRVMALDRDGEAIAHCQTYLPNTVQFWQGNFADYCPLNTQFDGIIADLGVSSPQFDQPQRGFSFQHSAPLDMRMDCRQSLTAGDIINHWAESELANIFYHYGEERLSRRIARRIVDKRPLQTTTELADLIASAVPPKYRYGRIHPATRVFQALRIAVNGELEALEQFLTQAPTWLKTGGRIGIISFHSLEDRLIKHSFRNNEQLKVLTKKPITAQPEEQAQNRRSRSAKLRFAQRI